MPWILPFRDNVMHPRWRLAPIRLRAAAPSSQQIQRSIPAVRAALKRYAGPLQTRLLEGIVLCDYLTRAGQPVEGTRWERLVYLPLKERDAQKEKADTAAVLAARLHRQIAFLIVSRIVRPEDLLRWAKLLSGYRYPDSAASSGDDLLPAASGNALVLEDKENAAGFVNRQARSDFESDFCLLAAALRDALNRHRLLREKADFVQEMYGRIHPGFSRAYFDAALSGKLPPVREERTGEGGKASVRLTQKTVRGVSIVTDFAPDASAVLPELWTVYSEGVKARPMPAAQVQRSLEVLSKALDVYSEPFLQRFLKRIVLCHDLYLGPLQTAGTYHRLLTGSNATMQGTLFLSSTGDDAVADLLFTPASIAEAFHHELSSLVLLEGYRAADIEDWERQLPRGFTYGNNVIAETLRAEEEEGEDVMAFSPRFLPDGFLTRYAKTDLENDFNTIASALFLGDPDFWQAFDRHPRIRAKARIALSIYSRYDPRITEDRCRRLRPLS
jgi:hypothetical protein